MNGAQPKIEIFKPFGEAFELMQKILFQPFDLAKWCVIGFAAFLAGGANFGLGFRLPSGNWNTPANASSFPRLEHLPGWLIALIAFACLIVLAIIVVLSWVKARGVFIFTDCIVRNRGAIVEPWKEFRREGNSLFLFSWLVVLLFLVIVALASLALIFPMISFGKDTPSHDIGFFIGLIFFFAVIFFAAVAWCFVSLFMVPIMYRRCCRALVALQESASLMMAYPVPILLYFLFLIVLAIGSVIAACAVTCLTCCVAAIPYVGTVILLPILVLFRAFLLLFLRQFGPDHDVWAGVQPAGPAPPPPSLGTPPLPA
jgi:hypothetical protein